MIKIVKCNNCEHKRQSKGFKMTCDAFPDGIPFSFDYDNVEKLEECNNGIKYKEKKSEISTLQV